MVDVNPALKADTGQKTQEPLIDLFEMDLQSIGFGVFRFCPTNTGSQPVSFGGVEYTPAPITADGFAWDGTGVLPRPTLNLATDKLEFLSLIVNYDDLVGAPVRRLRTYRKYLDDGAQAGLGIQFPVEEYVIDSKNSQSRHSVSFTLAMTLDQQGVQLPKLLVLRDTCVQHYRYYRDGQLQYDGVTCPYAGSNYFKRDGTPTTDPSEDVCGKRIGDCKLRFGDNATLPRLAFPGVDRV